MNPELIRKKFGDEYIVDENTFKMGIDYKITKQIAGRFRNRIVLETCTGAGFTTISLAKEAAKVITIEINPDHQKQAIVNAKKAKVIDHIEFRLDDILNENLLTELPHFDSAFLDPDWADTEPDHVYHFLNSNTEPPADLLLNRIFDFTQNAALILPPLIDINELKSLPQHEIQKIYLNGSLVLYCLYFGNLIYLIGETEIHV